jgi:AcrR family transcriptional regulator
MTNPERVRRIPRQERSKKRYEAILDAAAEVFASAGFEAATMEAVAAGAGTSIGSVYQFFPNKLALFQALAERSLERSRLLFDALMTPEAMARPWWELLEAAVDGYAALLFNDPGLRAIHLNFHLYGVYAEADAALNRELIDRTEAMIARTAPSLPRAKRHLIATMTVQILSAVLFLTAREKPDFARTMIDEVKVVLRRYLEPYAFEPRASKKRERKTPERPT